MFISLLKKIIAGNTISFSNEDVNFSLVYELSSHTVPFKDELKTLNYNLSEFKVLSDYYKTSYYAFSNDGGLVINRFRKLGNWSYNELRANFMQSITQLCHYMWHGADADNCFKELDILYKKNNLTEMFLGFFKPKKKKEVIFVVLFSKCVKQKYLFKDNVFVKYIFINVNEDMEHLNSDNSEVCHISLTEAMERVPRKMFKKLIKGHRMISFLNN